MMGDFMKKLSTSLTGINDPSKISSKRLIAMLLAATFIVVVLANVFLGKQIEEFIFDGLVTVLVWGLGFVGSEQFASALKERKMPRPSGAVKSKPKPTDDDEVENFD